MRNKHYKNKNFRISEEIYEELKLVKEKTDLSWNLLFKEMLDERKKL